jgi:hypothetical protein
MVPRAQAGPAHLAGLSVAWWNFILIHVPSLEASTLPVLPLTTSL